MKRPPTLTTTRLAWRQVRSRWAWFVPTAVGLAVALALGTAVVLTQSRTEEASLVQTVNGLGPHGLVTVRLTGVRSAADYNQFIADVGKAAARLGGLVTTRSELLYSARYVPTVVNGVMPANPGTDLEIAVLGDLPDHVDLVSGSWPAKSRSGDTVAVTMPEDAAKASRLKLGDRACMQVLDGKYVVCIKVAGIWRPRHISDAYWGPERSVPIAAFTDVQTYFDIVNAEPKIDPQPALVSVATVTLSPDLDAIRAVGANTALADLRRLHGEFGVERPDAVVVSDLEVALDQFVNQAALAAFAIDLVAVQLLLVALYCVWFLAGNVLAQQRPAIAVWRSRGWSWRGVSWLLWIELALAALVAAPAGIVGGWLASEAVARWVYRDHPTPPFHVDPGRLGIPIAAVLVAELVLLALQALLAGRHYVLSTRAAASRPPVPWWRRRYLDLLLALLAIPLLLQLRVLGSASVRSAGAADDPANLLLPGVAAAVIAVAAMRMLPFSALGLARVRRSVAARLASVQLLRAPGQHAGLAMLLLFAVAAGVFASTYSATAARNGADRAAYAAGADVRGTFGGVVGALPDGIRIVGAVARSSVFRSYARVGTEDDQILAVDPYSFKSVMYTRDDLASAPLPDLVQKLADRETGGYILPSTPKMLSLWVHAARTGGTLTAHLSDAGGRPLRADLGALDFTGWKQLSSPVVAEAVPIRAPVRLRDLAITNVVAPGVLGLSSLAVDGKVVETFAEIAGGPPEARFLPGVWYSTDPITGAYAESWAPTLDLPRNGYPTVAPRISVGPLPTYFRPGASTASITGFGGRLYVSGAIPALAPQQMLDRFGLAVGQTIQVDVDHIGVTAVIVGVADHFPTLYPELGDFLVLDRDPLLADLAYNEHQRPWPNEIWVRATPGGADAAVSSMKSAPGVVQVYDRRALETAAAQSPPQLELESNLVLGFAAAIGLGLLAFALHFVVVSRARLSDYAVLEANGMPQATIRRSLVVEQLVVLVFSAVGGALLGVLMSYILLPALQLGGAASDNVPQTIVVIGPGVFVVVLGVVVAGALAAPFMSAVSERPRVMSELRSLG